MTIKAAADAKGLTVEQYRQEATQFVLQEGYDLDGTEYNTLDAWIDRKKNKKVRIGSFLLSAKFATPEVVDLWDASHDLFAPTI